MNYILQPKHKHPHIFHNQKIATFLTALPWILFIFNIVIGFMFTDNSWSFLFSSIIMFIIVNTYSKKKSSQGIKIVINENSEEDKKLELEGGFTGLFNVNIPIDRGTFFHGLITIILTDYVLKLFMENITFLNNILAMWVVTLLVIYMLATWCTKRLFDIWRKIKTKITQVTLFFLFTISFIALTAASITENSYNFAIYFVFLLFEVMFIFFLLFKKGKNYSKVCHP